MTIFSWLALIFLTLAGYSAGAVLGFRTRAKGDKRDPLPSLLDMVMVIMLWIGGIASRLAGVKPWPAVGIWLVAGLAIAFILNCFQPDSDEGKPLPQ